MAAPLSIYRKKGKKLLEVVEDGRCPEKNTRIVEQHTFPTPRPLGLVFPGGGSPAWCRPLPSVALANSEALALRSRGYELG